jgi:hypothetical protein
LLTAWGKRGKFGSIFLILFGAYNLIWHDPNIYRLNSAIEVNKWTEKDKAGMIKLCIRGAGASAKKYPQIVLEYCTCSTDKIIHSIGRREFIADSSKSANEQFKIDSPFTQGYIIIANQQIDSKKK